jgi:two-component system, NarL family, response regulator FusR
MWSSQPDVRLLAEALRVGAGGSVWKGADLSELASALRICAHSRPFVSKMIAEPQEVASVLTEALNALTPRHRQVLVLLAGGKSNKEIAADLGISVRQLKNTVHR